MNRDTKRWIFDIAAWTAGMLAIALLIADAAASDRRGAVVPDAVWQAECGSCHVPFPPQLLPAASWRALMSRLDKHFGSDASIDAGSLAQISAFLEKNAGPETPTSTGAAPLLRVTETRWFRHEHSELPATRWTNSKVKGPSDCSACHRRAADGDFGERTLRLPR